MKLTNSMRDAFIRAVMDDVPSVDYTEQIRSAAMKAAIEAMPPKIQAAYKDPTSRDYITTHWFYGDIGAQLPGLRKEDLIKAAVASLVAKKDAQDAARSDLKKKLKGVAYSVTTRKALADALPEFEKYLPADEAAASRALPVVANVVSEFVKAGWPKDKKPAKAKAHALST